MKVMKAVMAFEDLISVWIQAVADKVSAVTCASYKCCTGTIIRVKNLKNLPEIITAFM